MTRVNNISIAGFRGILARLELDFSQGGQPSSVILYGGNGTGKSSVTDAWEWLTTGRILHLAREGAEEGAYPHMAAKQGATNVQAEFSDAAIGNIGLTFNNKKITIPTPNGNLKELRKLLTHPCHIRYGDLTRFVFLRKSERYDALATLMGFVPQMEYQKALRRVESQLKTELEAHEQRRSEAENEFKEHFNLTDVDREACTKRLVEVCVGHEFPTEASLVAVRRSGELLKAAVTNDPNAKKLADVTILEAAAKSCKVPPNLGVQVANLREAVAQLKAEQKENLQIQLLVPLFEAAEKLFSKLDPSGTCPLCQLQKF